MDRDIRPLEPADPRVVGGHPLLGRLGSGGMGTVYLGTDPVSGGRVAVKTIHPHLAGDPSYRRRFRDEADLASRVASFCTARVLSHGEEEGRPYLVTDYVGGVSLHHRLVGDGPLPPADLHGVAVGVASALAAIHAAGLVHRDLKPANVMLTLSGCRVIDFGIARSQDSHSATAATAATGKVFGTPGWMAPEVLAGGPATPAADIFAWGCLIAHAGTGRLPFGGDTAPQWIMTGEPDLAGLPEALQPTVRAALAKSPADRPTASDLLLTLVEQSPSGPAPAVPRVVDGRAADDSATQAFTPIGLGLSGALRSTRTRLLAGVGAAAGTVLIGAVVLGLMGDKDGSPTAPVSSAPVTPSVSTYPTKKAGTVRPRPSERPSGKTYKHKGRHGKGKGRHR